MLSEKILNLPAGLALNANSPLEVVVVVAVDSAGLAPNVNIPGVEEAAAVVVVVVADDRATL